jgi:hypothetical protein
MRRSQGDTRLEQRVVQLEQIVTYYTGRDTLDPKTLCDLVDSLDKPPASRGSVGLQSDESVYLGVDDENFTVQPLGNNITREAHYSPSCCRTNCRIH